MMQKAQVSTTRQPVNLLNFVGIDPATIEIPYEDDLVHHLEDDGTISHDPSYPDPDCPCHDDDQGDTSSDFAVALSAYCSDFYSISTAGNNTGGLCFEHQVVDRVLRGSV